MGALFLFVLGLGCGVMLTLYVQRSGGRRDLTAPPPRAASRPLVRVGDERISDEEIRDLIRGGHKIEAIKRMRDATGMGLAEAKDAVEAIERTLR